MAWKITLARFHDPLSMPDAVVDYPIDEEYSLIPVDKALAQCFESILLIEYGWYSG